MIETSLGQSETVPALPVRPFGSRARSVAAYGLGTALMMVSALVVFVPAALFHCAFRNGRRGAFAAFVLATTLAALYFAQVASVSPAAADRTLIWAMFLLVALAIAVPSIAALSLIERGQRFAQTLIFMIAGSAIGLGVTELIMRVTTSFSLIAFQIAQTEVTGHQLAQSGAAWLRDAERLTPFVVTVVPAMMLINLAFTFVVSLLMHGRITSWRSHGTASNTYLLRNFVLPDWMLFGFIFGGLAAIASGSLQILAANVLVLVYFLYMLQGIGIFRSTLAKAGAGVLATAAAFVIFIILTVGLGLLLLAVAGLFDPFFDFRHLKRKDDSHESHTD